MRKDEQFFKLFEINETKDITDTIKLKLACIYNQVCKDGKEIIFYAYDDALNLIFDNMSDIDNYQADIFDDTVLMVQQVIKGA